MRRRRAVIRVELLLHFVKVGIRFPENPDPEDVVLAAGGEQPAAMTELHRPDGTAVVGAAVAVMAAAQVAQSLNFE